MQPDPVCLRLPKRAFYRTVHAWRQPHVVQSKCSGIKLRYSSQNRIGEELFANAFERAERDLLNRIIAPGMTVLDIGANLGFYTCLFAQRVGPSGNVVGIEPTPSTFESLQENVRLNGYQDRVACHCCALSDSDGIAQLNLFGESSGGVYNSLGVTCPMDGTEPQCVIEVPTKTLDEICNGVDSSKGVFMKIDVEGFEQQVVRGGSQFLANEPRAAMMIELYEPAAQQCGRSTLDTLADLESFGFEPYYMAEGATLAPFTEDSRAKLLSGTLPPDVFLFKPSMRPQWV
ncbi:arsenite S-adenosylmethyltransferase [Rosistilla carotiformis]|uniref:Arsenite S-adenosylmethyltransferase n=1 Tax=Rosistilla carotiformis TaxID=2528017 RepID=A0A518JNY5_9BACT|nr:FkbM family methyltransferase [Rosistilla carotiformis]QDV67254.1 arsenite S-adenosylmethyltransferase [Rosistilla carotiformis]